MVAVAKPLSTKEVNEIMQIIGLAQAGEILTQNGVEDAVSCKELFEQIEHRLQNLVR